MWCARRRCDFGLKVLTLQTIAGHDALAIRNGSVSRIFVPSEGGHTKQLWLIY
jgi:hypothetical protein